MAVEIEIIKPGVTLLNGLQNTVTLTTPNSTLNIGTSGQDITLDINLGTANTWTGLQTFTGNPTLFSLPINGYIELSASDHESIYFTNGTYSSRIGVNYGSQNLYLDTNIDISTPPDGTVQTDTSLPSWHIAFGSEMDSLDISRMPAGGTAFTQLFGMDNGGNVSIAGNLNVTGTGGIFATANTWTGLQTFNGNANFNGTNLQITSQYVLFNEGLSGANPFSSFSVDGAISGGVLGQSDFDFFTNGGGSGFHWFSVNDGTGVLTSVMQLNVNGVLTSYKNTLDDGSGNMTVAGIIRSDAYYYSLFSLPQYILQTASPATTTNPEFHFESGRFSVDEANIVSYDGSTVRTILSVFYSSNELQSANNTLDDGSGNMLIAGNLYLPDNNNSTTYKLQMAGKSDLAHYIVSSGTGGNTMTFGEWQEFIFYNTDGNYTAFSINNKVVNSFNNTIDDGSGNMTVAGHVSAPVLSGNLTVYTSGSGTYTVPAGCSVIKVILVGGGGGGQGGDGEEERTAGEWVAGNGGNGGGAGGATEATFYVTAGQTFSYAVGAGGAGGRGGATDCSGTTATNGGSGSNGGNSTFAFLTADGGAGGTSSGAGGGGSSPNPIAFAGGAGKAGSAGVGSTTACVDATGGNGGAGGSNELIYTGSYGNGGAGGKGGGGGADGQAGSAGTDGAIIIEQF